MKKKNWKCPWCGKSHELTKNKYNKLPESVGQPGSVFKELTCSECGKISYMPPALTPAQWNNLQPGENFMLES